MVLTIITNLSIIWNQKAIESVAVNKIKSIEQGEQQA